MVMVGFRLVIGSWKTVAICLPRTRRIWAASSGTRSFPDSSTEPETMRPPGGSIFMMDMAVMVLPQPDSPTRPTVSPRRTVNDTPSTGCTASLRRRMSVRRSCTRSSSVTRRSPFLQPDFERGPQRVADEVEGHDRQHDGDAGRVDQPPLALVDVVQAVGQHVAPVGRGRRRAQAQV